MKFSRIVREVRRDDTLRRVRESEQLIYDTVHGNAEAVAEQIEKSIQKKRLSTIIMNRRCEV